MQNRCNFSQGDVVFCSGYFTVNNGMIILRKIRRIENLEENHQRADRITGQSKFSEPELSSRINQQMSRLPRTGPCCMSFMMAIACPQSRVLFCLKVFLTLNYADLIKKAMTQTDCPQDDFNNYKKFYFYENLLQQKRFLKWLTQLCALSTGTLRTPLSFASDTKTLQHQEMGGNCSHSNTA